MGETSNESTHLSAGIDLTQFYQVFFEEAGENLESMEQMLLNLDIEHADEEDGGDAQACAFLELTEAGGQGGGDLSGDLEDSRELVVGWKGRADRRRARAPASELRRGRGHERLRRAAVVEPGAAERAGVGFAERAPPWIVPEHLAQIAREPGGALLEDRESELRVSPCARQVALRPREPRACLERAPRPLGAAGGHGLAVRLVERVLRARFVARHEQERPFDDVGEGRVLAEPRLAAARGEILERLRAVSYTHLTLPTSDLV